MIDHLSTYAIDFDASKKFYEGTMASLGYAIQMEIVAEWNTEFPTQRMCAFGIGGKPTFWIVEVKENHTPRHVAFSATNRDIVDSFYQAAIENGGTDNGKPGLRPMYHEHYYGAFAIDPDGNNVEAVCHLPQ